MNVYDGNQVTEQVTVDGVDWLYAAAQRCWIAERGWTLDNSFGENWLLTRNDGVVYVLVSPNQHAAMKTTAPLIREINGRC